MSDHLPQEIWTEILKRLPVKWLLQYRCVSKSWYVLISSPNFITTQTKHTIQVHKQSTIAAAAASRLLVSHLSFTNNGQNYIYPVHYDDDSFGESHELDFPNPDSVNRIQIVGSCNGLLCLSLSYLKPDGFRPGGFYDFFDGHAYIIWNPAIRHFVNLPVRVCNTARHSFLGGFGFDPKTNDYKLLRIVYHQMDDWSNSVPDESEIYDLSKGVWRAISVVVPPCDVRELHFSEVFLNGALHWTGFGPLKVDGFCERILVSFDLSEEMFRELKMPSDAELKMTTLVEGLAEMTDIMALGELLSVVLFKLRKTRWQGCVFESCSIWVMKEYGVAESWVKRFNIDLLSGGLGKPLHLRKNGEILMTNKGWLASYDPDSGKVKRLLRTNTCAFYICTYMETLVLLEGKGKSWMLGCHNSANVIQKRSHSAVDEDNIVKAKKPKGLTEE